jgi:hypothetical protein
MADGRLCDNNALPAHGIINVQARLPEEDIALWSFVVPLRA